MIRSPEELMRHLAQLPPDFTVAAHPLVWMSVVGCVQLALRHPTIPPSIAEAVRHWVEAFADGMPPDVAQHIRDGFDARKDQPIPCAMGALYPKGAHHG